MIREIRWTQESIDTFERVIAYLTFAWTEKEVQNFIFETEKVLKYISQNPRMFKRSLKLDIHEAIITEHNLLIYKVYPTRIDLITFWDTRQNPKKKRI